MNALGENPALIGFVAILAFTVFQAAMTWLGRRHFREVADLSQELLSDPGCNDVDRAWIRCAMDNALDRQVILLGPFAPLIVLVLVGAVIWEEIVQKKNRFPIHPAFRRASGLSEENLTEESLYRQAKELDERLDAASARVFSQAAGVDVETGGLWDDPRRKRLLSEALDAQRYRAPISWMWTSLWLVLAVFAAGAVAIVVGGPVALVRKVASPLRQQTTRLVNALHLQGRVL